MKKAYNRPEVKIELFELNEKIAAGCTVIVDFGPDEGCRGYNDGNVPDDISLYNYRTTRTNFYNSAEAGCECYMNAGDSVMFTS